MPKRPVRLSWPLQVLVDFCLWSLGCVGIPLMLFMLLRFGIWFVFQYPDEQRRLEEINKIPLFHAIYKKDTKEVERLLATGTDLHVTCEYSDEDYNHVVTPLMFAAEIGDVKIVQTLLNHDPCLQKWAPHGCVSTLNIEDVSGTALDYAADHPDVCKLLVKYGAKKLQPDTKP